MASNRMGLTFEALIHENKKRPNNRLQKMLNQKLQNIESMRNETERIHRKETADLSRRHRIYSRIIGSLTRDLDTQQQRETRAFRITDVAKKAGGIHDSEKLELPPIGLGGIAPWTVEEDILITNLEEVDDPECMVPEEVEKAIAKHNPSPMILRPMPLKMPLIVQEATAAAVGLGFIPTIREETKIEDDC